MREFPPTHSRAQLLITGAHPSSMAEQVSSRKRPLEHTSEEEEKDTPKKKKTRTQSRKKRPGFDEEIFSETSYVVQNGLRYVKPYYFTFSTHAKGRWVGRTVYDVFCKEFQSETPEFYERALKAGKVTVDGVAATMETVITNNAFVCHKVHRHEPPVAADPLKVVHEDEQLVVINKPASIPVHPCGRYRHNTVVFLLAKEYKLRNLHTIHRLDRLTSGLLMFAKSLHTAQKLEQQIRDRLVTKEYVCRVQGEFPSDPIECNEPILVVSHKLGVCQVTPTGKPCHTQFTRLSYNSSSSVVKCVPKTGRMHQIRVHLQWLGYPILNDPLYNHCAWGREKGKQGRGVADMDQVILEIVKTNYSSEKSAHEPLRTAVEVDSGGGEVERCGGGGDMERCRGGGDMERCGGGGEVESRELEQTAIATSNSVGTHALESPHGSSHMTTCDDEQQRSYSPDSDRAPLEGYASCQPPASVGDVRESNTVRCVEKTKSTSPPGYDLPVDSSYTESAGAGGVQAAPCMEGDIDPSCTECGIARADPTPSDLIMFLHALSYKGPDWEFSTDAPLWAAPNWKEDKHRTTQ